MASRRPATGPATFTPGERVRLRIINGSSMSFFDLRIPGLKLTVVATDGQDVEPVTVDELRIGTAEVYDVIVEPRDAAYTIFAQSMDRSGYARGTLAPRAGMTAEVPALDARGVAVDGRHGPRRTAAARSIAARWIMRPWVTRPRSRTAARSRMRPPSPDPSSTCA